MSRVFLSLSGVVGVAVGGIALTVFITGDPGTRSADLTAVGTLGAVFVSLLFSIDSVVRERSRERTEAEKVENIQHRGQAESVWWWLEECPTHLSPFLQWEAEGFVTPFRLDQTDKCWGINLVVENRSDCPITSITMISSDYIISDLSLGFYESLGGSSKRTYHLSAAGCSLLNTPPFPGTSVFFTDSKGVRWVRAAAGFLEEQSETIDEIKAMAEEAERFQRNAAAQASGVTWDQGLNMEIVTAVSDGSVRRRIEEFDERTFKALQDVPLGSPRRIVAEKWWMWRSGAVKELRDLFPS